MRSLIICLGLLASLPAMAELDPRTRSEVEQLFTQMRQSACQFERNGTVYDADEAVAHLTRKLSYFDDKGKIARSEDFIRLAASKSSMSGKPYHIICPEQAKQDSADWLNAALMQIRQKN